MRVILATAVLAIGLSSPAAAMVKCGGSFSGFVTAMKKEARSKGHSKAAVDTFFAGVRQDAATLKADRAQGIFQKSFLDFSRALISQNRMAVGQSKLKKHAAIFDRMERSYGVSRGVLTAFWAFETDYGAFQGNFNTLNSLMTLSHDCRRPELFQPQVFAALELFERGSFNPKTSTGAWAGEIGMVQMLPGDIIEAGVDGNGDGKVDLRRSPADALLSGANMLRQLGWRANEPWVQEVTLPKDFDWSKTGLGTQMKASQWGRFGGHAACRQALRKPAGFDPFAAGAQGARVHRLPQFSGLFRMEQELHLCDDGRLFCHPSGGRACIQGWQPGSGTVRCAVEAVAKEAGGARA